ncbi:MAG: hypothetical protein WCK02_16090 [Bacteroidota bacterium]
MQNFPEFQNENMGGCQCFCFAPFSKLAIMPLAKNALTTDLIFSTGSVWFIGLAILNTLDFQEETSNSDSGTFYKTKITGLVPSLNIDILILFNEMKQLRHLIKIADNNGNTRICGLNGGLKFAFTQDTKKLPAGTSGIEFEFTGENPEPSPFLI